MELITKKIEEAFRQHPLRSGSGNPFDRECIVKYFNPVGVGTWFITEAEQLANGDWEMYGFCHLGDDDMAEWGYVMLSDLQNLRLPFGMSVERDLYASGTVRKLCSDIGIKINDFF